MNVLSLFDGISCGMVALERAEISVERYVAYEIEPNAIKISKKNYPQIEHCGDVTTAHFTQYSGFDLLIGGSPCQDLSNYKYGTEGVRGLEGDKSSLFYYYVKALREIKPKYFLFENVASMEKKWADVISQELGVTPIFINSALVCAAERKRLYWTNIPNIQQPKNKEFLLRDIVLPAEQIPEKYWYSKYPITVHEGDVKVKATIHLNGHRQTKEVYSLNHKCNTILCDGNGGNLVKKVFQNNKVRKLTPLEYERLQTLPDNYTDCVSDSRRYTAIGNGWTVDVITHVLSNLKGVKTMIKCGQIASEEAATLTCGKDICCYQCEQREGCEDACTYYEDQPEQASECEDRIDEETALATMQEKAAAVIQAITDLVKQKRKIEDQEKAMKEQLMKTMKQYRVKKFENGVVSFTYVAPTVENRLDSKALKADLPDVAAKYTKQQPKAGYVKVTVK